MEREGIKMMIELAGTIEEADSIIEEFTRFRSTEQKLAYLYGMFDVSILGACGDSDSCEADYQSILSTIINQKWR